MKIGIIGAGYVGRGVAQLAARGGHQVMISNSRDLRSLHSVVGTIQRDFPDATIRAGTAEQAATFGDAVLIALPLYAYKDLPAEVLAGKIVLDATNHYPERDGLITELDGGATMTGELIARHLPGARVVKVFNAIPATDLDKGQPAGTPNRRAQPIADDDAGAKALVTELLDQFGFDTVDAGPLVENRRFAPDTPPYCVPLDAAGLRTALE